MPSPDSKNSTLTENERRAERAKQRKLKAEDERFQQAMRQAIASGNERER
jgi:hypothetical protein